MSARSEERWSSVKGFAIVLACCVAVLLALWLLSQFFNLDPDDA